jgi:hypothetical protein
MLKNSIKRKTEKIPGTAILSIRRMPIKVPKNRYHVTRTFDSVRSPQNPWLHAWVKTSKNCSSKMTESYQVPNTKKPLI